MFRDATTLKRIFVGSITYPTGGGVAAPLPLPRTGILSRIYVLVTGTVGGTVNGANALGMASVVNRCRIVAQGGQDMFNLSGFGYHYAYRPYLDVGQDVINSQSAYAAVTATTFDVSMIFPVQFNMRDEVGLFLLQNAETLVTVNLDFNSATTVGGSTSTLAVTTKVYADIFTVPGDPKNLPDLSMIHQVLEDQITVAGSGQVIYEWPRGSIYLRQLHLLGAAQAGSDAFSSYQIKRNESDILYDVQDTTIIDKAYGLDHLGGARKAGHFFWDGVGYSGLGSYGQARDTLDSRRYTNLKTSVVATGAGTLYAVRDTLLPIGRPG